jgi:hypothetical protein
MPTTILGYFLFFIGSIVCLLGELRFMVVVYRHSSPWFLCCLFVPFVWLGYFLLHFNKTWRPVMLSTVGLLIAALGCGAAVFGFSK